MRRTYAELEPLWDSRTGLVHHGSVSLYECVRRLHRALPTTAHAEQLITAMLEQLGDRGRLDPYTNGTSATVRQSDPDGWWLRRSPASLFHGAEQNECDSTSEVPHDARPADAPPGWAPGTPFRQVDPPPDIAPAGLGRAVLTLCAGDALMELRYDDQGLAAPRRVLCRFGDRWADRRFAGVWPPTVDPAARPPQPQPPPWLIDFPDEPTSVEALAERMLATDPAADPVRVRMTVDAPGGVEGRWFQARMALRALAGAGSLPRGGGVCVIDAFEHAPEASCLAMGTDLADALANWLVEERRLRPKPDRRRPIQEEPPDPEPAPEPTDRISEDGASRIVSTGLVRLVIRPVREIPWPIPGPRTTPLVAIHLPAAPTQIPAPWSEEGFTRWQPLVGDSGRVGFALVRDERDGFTMVGDGLVDALDPRWLDGAMEAAVATEHPFPFEEPPWLRYPYQHRWFRGWSDLRQGPAPLRADGAAWNEHWNWRGMDGDIDRWRIGRMRYRGG